MPVELQFAVRVAAFIIGLLLVLTFARSMMRVALVNHPTQDGVSRNVHRLAYYVSCVLRPGKLDDISAQQRRFLSLLPVFIFLLIFSWFFLVQTGFTLMIWSVHAETRLVEAFIASGSALSTLGFRTPPSTLGQMLAIPEGAIGLGVVVFIFTFIPGYKAAVLAREDKTAHLHTRTRGVMTGVELLRSAQRGDMIGDMSDSWHDWEKWFRMLHESHAVTPVLILVPSVFRGQIWVAAASTVIDAASLAISTLDVKGLEAGRICHQAGAEMLQVVAAALPMRETALARTEAYVTDASTNFDAAYDKLLADGFPVRGDREACRRTFLACPPSALVRQN